MIKILFVVCVIVSVIEFTFKTFYSKRISSHYPVIMYQYYMVEGTYMSMYTSLFIRKISIAFVCVLIKSESVILAYCTFDRTSVSLLTYLPPYLFSLIVGLQGSLSWFESYMACVLLSMLQTISCKFVLAY